MAQHKVQLEDFYKHQETLFQVEPFAKLLFTGDLMNDRRKAFPMIKEVPVEGEASDADSDAEIKKDLKFDKLLGDFDQEQTGEKALLHQ